MTMVFTTGWDLPKLAAVPALGPTPSNKQLKQKAYIEQNNQKRADGALFLTLFNETDVRSAVQKASSRFKQEAAINTLLADMIGTTTTIRIDQGTHQDEDRTGGGFKLHFDARRPDNLCFHLYVGQAGNGALEIIEISYMNGGTKVEAHPV